MAGAWIGFQCLETQAFQAILGNNDTRQVAFSIYICLIWSNHQLERFTNYAYIVHSFYFGTWVHAGCIGYTNGLVQNTNHTTISWNKRQDLKLSVKIRREQTSEPDWLAIYYDLNLHRLYHSFKSSSMPVWQSGKTRMWSLLKPSLFVVRYSRILATCHYWARLSQQQGEKSPSAYINRQTGGSMVQAVRGGLFSSLSWIISKQLLYASKPQKSCFGVLLAWL